MASLLRILVSNLLFIGVLAGPPNRVGTNQEHVALVSTNPCDQHLPLWDGASGVAPATLRGGGYTLVLLQYGPRGTHDLLRQLGALPPRQGTVVQFTFTLPGHVHRYSGLLHAWPRGSTLHLCAHQPLYVDHDNSARSLAHPHTVMMTINGIVTVTKPDMHGFVTMLAGQFTITAGPTRYHVYGFMDRRAAPVSAGS